MERGRGSIEQGEREWDMKTEKVKKAVKLCAQRLVADYLSGTKEEDSSNNVLV